MKKRMNSLVFVSCIFFLSCTTTYKVNKTGLRSNNFIDKLIISKVDSVVSFDKWGIPNNYLLEDKYELIYINKDEVQKNIKFFISEPEYSWVLRNDTLPFLPKTFESKGWFIIYPLKNFDRGRGGTLIYYNGKHRVKQYYRSLYFSK